MIGPMEHTGNSANIAFYRECGKRTGVWCEALRSVPMKRVDGVMERDRSRPTGFGIRVYRTGEGELFDFKYVPKTQPPPFVLPPRTVARLIREELARRR